MIYKPFNLTFWIILLCFVLFMIGTIRYLSGKDKAFVKRWLYVYFTIGIVIFFAYKIILINDLEYVNEYLNGVGSIFGELPLYPCNLVLWLTPIAIFTERRGILAFCFFVSLVAAPVALLLPSYGFLGYSIMLPRVMGFVFTHLMVLSACIYLYSLKIYRPETRDIPRMLVSTMVLTTLIHFLNLALSASGLCGKANYFFTMFPENDFLTSIYNVIPISFVYILPLVVALSAIAFLVSWVLGLKNKLTQKDN